MKAFLIGLAVAVVLAVASGLVYNFAPITAADYFSSEYARLHEGMPEQYRGEEGQR